MRCLPTAQHEAAHIVVGCALGLRVTRATLEQIPGYEWSGIVWFDGRAGALEAWALMFAAGVAWEKAAGEHPYGASGDASQLRSMGYTKKRSQALVIASAAMLANLGPVHARVTRALIERDLDGRDLATLASGEPLAL